MTTETPTRTDWLDPAALMRINSLELRARVVMEGFWKGMHRSPLHGFSAEFSEYRAYVAGDDPRFMDWKVVARSDRYFVKKFEEETNLRSQLLLDVSASMAYGTTGFTKLDYARTLTATLGLFLMQQGDAVGLTLFDQGITDYLPPRKRAGQLHALMMRLQRAGAGRGTSLGISLKNAGELIRRRALIVLISDFLAPLDSLEAELALLGAMRHDVVIFQVLDRSEIEFNFDQAAAFNDIESGRQLLIEPDAARASYLSRFSAHQSQLRSICDRQGVELRLMPTDVALEGALFEFLSARRRLANRHRTSSSASSIAA
jgi:uncharacterized protein (DUF58 family)